jgi:hypothetical protein
MSFYDDRLGGHGVWAATAAARTAWEAVEESLADPEQVEIHARIGVILDYLERQLEDVDALLVPVSALDGVAANLAQLAGALQQFAASPGNRSVLDSADAPAQGILTYLAQIPQQVTTEDIENLRVAGERYRRAMGAHARNVATDVAELRERVEEVRQAAQSVRAQIDAETERVTTALTSQQADFEASLTGFRTEMDSAVASANESVDQAIAEASTKVGAALVEVQERASEMWEEVGALEKRAQEASNYLGINALASGYHETAEKEERSAYWMRVLAIIAFVGAVLVALGAVAYHIASEFSLEGFLTKALVAAPILALAGYLAHESSLHRERATFNRHRQRQLESLPAYADGLEPQDRAALYALLAPGFYSPGPAAVNEEASSQPVTPEALAQLVERLSSRGVDE